MKKFFSDSEEKYLRSVVLYAHTDNCLYFDDAHKDGVDKDTLLNMCMKGIAVINTDDTFYKPVFFKENSGKYVEVTIATSISSDSFTSKTLYSVEKLSAMPE